MKYLHPFDVPDIEPNQFVDLRDGSIHDIPVDAPAPRRWTTPNALVVTDGIQLANAVKRSDVSIALTEEQYVIGETLEFGQNVDLLGQSAKPARIVAGLNFKSALMMHVAQPGVAIENIELDGGFNHLPVNGIELEDASDVLIRRCRLKSFQRVCLRMTGHTSNVAVLFCEMTDTLSNHGVGMRETVTNVLIASSLFHKLGTKGDNDGFGLDLHGGRLWSLGNVVVDCHRGIKLPDSFDVEVDRCLITDGVSHRYPPVSIWRSNEGYGRRPKNIQITNCTLDSQSYHIGVWNSDNISYGNITALRDGKAVDKDGEPIKLLIKGTATPIAGMPSDPPPPAGGGEEPPAGDTGGSGDDAGGELDEQALQLLTDEVMRRLDINELAHLVGKKLVSSLGEVFK